MFNSLSKEFDICTLIVFRFSKSFDEFPILNLGWLYVWYFQVLLGTHVMSKDCVATRKVRTPKAKCPIVKDGVVAACSNGQVYVPSF